MNKNKHKMFKRGTILRSTMRGTETDEFVVSVRGYKNMPTFKALTIGGSDRHEISKPKHMPGCNDDFFYWEPIDPLELFKPHVKTKPAGLREPKVGDVFIDRIVKPDFAWVVTELDHDMGGYNTMLISSPTGLDFHYRVGDKSPWYGSYVEGFELVDISSLIKRDIKPESEPGAENADGFTYDIYSVIKLNKPFSDAYRVKTSTVNDSNLVEESILGLGTHEVVVGYDVEVCYNGITLDIVDSWHWSNYITRGGHPDKPDIPKLSYYEYLVLLMLFEVDANDEYSGEGISTNLFNRVMLARLGVMGLINPHCDIGGHIWYSLEHDRAKMAIKNYNLTNKEQNNG